MLCVNGVFVNHKLYGTEKKNKTYCFCCLCKNIYGELASSEED